MLFYGEVFGAEIEPTNGLATVISPLQRLLENSDLKETVNGVFPGSLTTTGFTAIIGEIVL